MLSFHYSRLLSTDGSVDRLIDTRNRNYKRNERNHRFSSLDREYHEPLSSFNKTIINTPIEDLVQDVQSGKLSPLEVLTTYGKVAVKAHKKTNCVTELLLPEAEQWATEEANLKGPLAGIPVSLKDSIQVKGFDISLGYSTLACNPYKEDGPLVRLLKDAGWCFFFFLKKSPL